CLNCTTQSLISFLLPVPASASSCTLPLHDALPIYHPRLRRCHRHRAGSDRQGGRTRGGHAGCRGGSAGQPSCRRHGKTARRESADRKSTRLNSSHSQISYAVFCLKKKKTTTRTHSL